MTEPEELRGRIVALETMTLNLLVNVVAESANPPAMMARVVERSETALQQVLEDADDAGKPGARAALACLQDMIRQLTASYEVVKARTGPH